MQNAFKNKLRYIAVAVLAALCFVALAFAIHVVADTNTKTASAATTIVNPTGGTQTVTCAFPDPAVFGWTYSFPTGSDFNTTGSGNYVPWSVGDSSGYETEFSYAEPGSNSYSPITVYNSYDEGYPYVSAYGKGSSDTTYVTSNFYAMNAGTYRIASTPKSGYVWRSGGTATIYTYCEVKQISASLMTSVSGSYTYDGTAKKPSVTVVYTHQTRGGLQLPTSDYTLSYSGNVNAGTATVTIDPINFAGTFSANFTIAKAPLSSAISSLTALGTYTYDGTAQTPKAVSITVNGSYAIRSDQYNISTSQTNAGSYDVTLTATAGSTNNYIEGSTYTTSDKPFTIAKAQISSAISTVTGVGGTYAYTGSLPTIASSSVAFTKKGDHTLSASDFDVKAEGFTAGTHNVILTAKSTSTNYTGSYTTTGSPLTIDKAKVTEPARVNGSLTYNGEPQWGVTGYDSSTMTEVSGYVSRTDAGTYNVEIGLADDKNYDWSTGGTANLKFSYTIAKAKLAAPAKVNTAFVYDGSYKQGISGFDGNTMEFKAGGEQSVSATTAGTHTVVIGLKDTANYEWADGGNSDITITYTIAKGEYTEANAAELFAAIKAFSGKTFSIKQGDKLPAIDAPAYVIVSYSYAAVARDGSTTPTEPGTYTITATFTPLNSNYNAPAAVTATLVILAEGEEPEEPDDPTPDEPVNPTPDDPTPDDPVDPTPDDPVDPTPDTPVDPVDPDDGNGDEGSLPIGGNDSVFGTDLGVFIVLLGVEFIVFILLLAMVVVSAKRKEE